MLRLTLCAALLPFALAAHAATFTVTSASSGGSGSLRTAIESANDAPGADTIAFAIPGPGPHRISVDNLPFVNDALTIDGYTQPGAQVNTLASGSNAVIQIELTTSSDATVLSVCNGPTLVRGLAIFGASFADIVLRPSCPGPLTVRGNFVGLRADGVTQVFLSGGVRLSSANGFIGGAAPADRNLLVGNTGINVDGVGGVIDGNLIGADRFGRPLQLSAGSVAIRVRGVAAADQTLIGTIAPNRLTGYGTGIAILEQSTRVNARNNQFVDLQAHGIDLAPGSSPDGVTANDPDDPDAGPNNLQNFPLVTAATRIATGVSVSGTLDRPNTAGALIYTISVHASRRCDTASRRSGEIPLGTLTFASAGPAAENFSGNVASAAAIPYGAFITLTATDSQGNTSEFSPCFALADPAPFVVSKTADTNDGACNADCSLREAIVAANAQAGADRIHFNIPGAGPHTITPGAPLPTLSQQTLIDGYTQPGSVPNTAGFPLNTQLRVELLGSSAGAGADGLVLNGIGSEVRGLAVRGFADRQIEVLAAEAIIAGNFIGIDAAGTGNHGIGSIGIILLAPGARVGGTLAADANLIGKLLNGLVVANAAARVLRNQFGGTAAYAGDNAVLASNAGAQGSPNVLGDVDAALGNLISHHTRGVAVAALSGLPLSVQGNRIQDNAQLGIDLGNDGVSPNDPDDVDGGPNGLQNFPVLRSAALDSNGSVQLNFTLDLAPGAGVGFRFDFYASSACDSSGNGEGASPVLSELRTNPANPSEQYATTLAALPVGTVLTATATDPSGNTSEFSNCVVVQPLQVFRNGFE